MADVPLDRSSPASESNVDPVLSAALSEMETEGFRADDPISQPADETPESTDAVPTGHTPAEPAPTATRESHAPTVAVADAPPDDEAAFTAAPALTFTVDGQARTFDFMKVFPGEGALIREADLPKLQTELANATHYLAESQKLARAVADLERVSQWTYRDAQGNEQTLKGRDAIEKRAVDHGIALASLQTMASVFKRPVTDFLVRQEDGSYLPEWNTAALKQLDREASLAEKEIAFAVRDQLAKNVTVAQQQETSAQQQAQTPARAWGQAETHWLKDFPHLTEKDKADLKGNVTRFLRGATREEIQAGQFKPNEPVLDPSFYELIKAFADRRTESTASAKAAEAAGKHNGAMQRARQPVRTNTPKPAAAAPSPAQKVGKEAAWSSVLENALAEMNT